MGNVIDLCPFFNLETLCREAGTETTKISSKVENTKAAFSNQDVCKREEEMAFYR